MERKMDKLDIPPIPEFIEMIADTGAGVYACKASVDLFELGEDDLVEQVQGIITVGEFYERAAGGQIVYTRVARPRGRRVAMPRINEGHPMN
jgi:peroxiredoxin family protein